MFVSDALGRLVSAGTGSPEGLGPSAAFIAPLRGSPHARGRAFSKARFFFLNENSPTNRSRGSRDQSLEEGAGKASLWCLNTSKSLAAEVLGDSAVLR